MFKVEDISMPPSSTQEFDFLTLDNDNLLPVGENDFIYSYLNPISGNEDTLDVAAIVVPHAKHNQQKEFVPISPRGPPERKIDSERSNFVLEIDGSKTQKKTFLYSHILNRIFVDMKCNFSVNFNWDTSKVPPGAMFIRATVVFADPEQAEKRVERCLQHSHVTQNAQTTDAVVINNVLRSARELGDPNVYYCGNPNESDSWYSVLVRLNGPTGHAYQFVCKNSCSSGINRRALDIIFTLEDSSGAVYGRQTVGARACSCPRRDKNTQEQELQAKGGKRPLPPKEAPSKKIKLEVVSNEHNDVVTLSKTDAVRMTIHSLKAAHSMADKLRASSRPQQPIEELDAWIACTDSLINYLEKES